MESVTLTTSQIMYVTMQWSSRMLPSLYCRPGVIVHRNLYVQPCAIVSSKRAGILEPILFGSDAKLDSPYTLFFFGSIFSDRHPYSIPPCHGYPHVTTAVDASWPRRAINMRVAPANLTFENMGMSDIGNYYRFRLDNCLSESSVIDDPAGGITNYSYSLLDSPRKSIGTGCVVTNVRLYNVS